MIWLVAGLILFLGVHSTGLLAPAWREQQISKLGKPAWKGIYAVLSLVGLVLIVIGYGQARMEPTWIWMPPVGLRHLVLLLMVPVFILLVATYVPGNAIRAKLGHPMLAAVKLWALSHLLANGTVADILLFGSFLAWAVAGFVVLRRRDRLAGKEPEASNARATAGTIVGGLVLWYFFAAYLHVWLFGVSPMPGG